MTWETLLVESGPIATITINRPQALNALNEQVLSDLLGALGAVGGDPATRVVLLTGAGEKAFVAGADIAAMADMDPRRARAFAEMGHGVGEAIAALPVPVIAAVNGFALGGGCELALACDMVFASQKARFGQPEVNLGVMPGFGGTQRLPRLVGLAKAAELLMTGDMIAADEALRLGLVNAVFEPAELLPRTRAVAEKIAAKGRLAIADIKHALRRGADRPLDVANEIERQLFAGLFATRDQEEGMKAFLEKRPAAFEGR